MLSPILVSSDRRQRGSLSIELNLKAVSLPLLVMKCWQLIVQHMKSRRPRALQNVWFEIAPQISRGEHSAALLERISDALRPKLKLSRRISLYDTPPEPPMQPADLMSIDYEVEDGLSADEVLQAWPDSASAETDSRLLLRRTAALSAALEDATDAGVEGDLGYGTSDSDVPSVARHGQNLHRSGFQAICYG